MGITFKFLQIVFFCLAASLILRTKKKPKPILFLEQFLTLQNQGEGTGLMPLYPRQAAPLSALQQSAVGSSH